MRFTKKVISIFLSVIALITCVFSTTAFATNDNAIEDNVIFSEEEFKALNPIHAEYEENSKLRATGLILGRDFAIGKNGSSLVMSGYTMGSSETQKVGFKEVIIERRKNSSSSWSEYKVYEDLYSSSTKYTLSKAVTVASGYQYRVTAVHYAKKSLFSTQKITATTGYLSF